MKQFGGNSKTIWLKGPEAHKLHNEFEVKGTNPTDGSNLVSISQPVVLNADGTVSAASADSTRTDIIGYSIHNGKNADLVTVVMIGFTMIYAKPNADLEAGPVKTSGSMNTTDKTYLDVVASDDPTNQIGWAIDAGTKDSLVRVVLF